MSVYTSEMPNKRHIQFRQSDGVLYSEEVFGTEGFDDPTSTMYHIHPPTQVSGWKHEYSTKPEYVETNVMRMRHLVSKEMKADGDPITGRTILFGNGDCEQRISGAGSLLNNSKSECRTSVHDSCPSAMNALRESDQSTFVMSSENCNFP